MWLNSTAQNALRAVLYIAEHGVEGPVRAADIARSLGCPSSYLSKTLHALTRAGVLRSVRGRHGGFRLTAPARRLVVARVVAPFQPSLERRCLLGWATCGDTRPCPVHQYWTGIASDVESFFGQTTVADLMMKGPASCAS
jgi:Rrf2 family protein